MVYGLIIAAGKQSRFSEATPKALMAYKNSTLLDINIENMEAICDEVYVVTSYENTQWFKGHQQLVIESGYGCGDAVMRALALLKLNSDDTVFIQWGDCLHTKQIYRDLKNIYVDKWLIPCVREDNPYVQVVQEADYKIHIYFSKYNEPITGGYHDLSLFYGNAVELQQKLVSFADSIRSNENKIHLYKHKHGNEMQFLDVFNETNLKGQIIEYTEYDMFAFNTVEEFTKLINS